MASPGGFLPAISHVHLWVTPTPGMASPQRSLLQDKDNKYFDRDSRSEIKSRAASESSGTFPENSQESSLDLLSAGATCSKHRGLDPGVRAVHTDTGLHACCGEAAAGLQPLARRGLRGGQDPQQQQTESTCRGDAHWANTGLPCRGLATSVSSVRCEDRHRAPRRQVWSCALQQVDGSI